MSTRRADMQLRLAVVRTLITELQSNGYTYEKIGRIIGVSSRTAEKYISGDTSMTLDSFLTLIEETKPTKTMQYLSSLTGGVFVPVPTLSDDVADALTELSDLGKEFSEVVFQVSEAVNPAGDGGVDITKKEAKQLDKELDDVVTKALRMKEHMKEIINGKS